MFPIMNNLLSHSIKMYKTNDYQVHLFTQLSLIVLEPPSIYITQYLQN